MNFQIPLELEFKVEFGNMPNPSETRLIMERIFFRGIVSQLFLPTFSGLLFSCFCIEAEVSRRLSQCNDGAVKLLHCVQLNLQTAICFEKYLISTPLAIWSEAETFLIDFFSLWSFFLWLCKRCEGIFLKLVNILVWVFTNKWRSAVQSAISHFATSSRLPYFNRWKYSADWI